MAGMGIPELGLRRHYCAKKSVYFVKERSSKVEGRREEML